MTTAPHAAAAQVGRGMVAAPHPAAARAGVEMLRAGGNAFDAVAAAAFALCVVTPASTGIGGYGGAMVAYAAGPRAAVAVDFTSTAPAAAREDMFPVEDDAAGGFTVPGAVNALGARSIGVPGVVAGLFHVLQRHGSLPPATVMDPAIAAARDGFRVDRWTEQKMRETLVPHASRYPETVRLYSIDGRLPREGEILRNPDLAQTLQRIARHGPDVFYRGDLARAIVDTVRRGGGALAMDDLAAFEVDEHAPAQGRYRGLTVFTPRLPAGGLSVLQMLGVLERFDVPAARDDADLAHLIVETGKVCWRERLLRYGDPRVVAIDHEAELRAERIEALRDRVDTGLRSPAPGEVIAPDPLLAGTVHLSAADRLGNVVSLTHSHGGSFGSLVTVPGTGILLSHGLSRFDPRPGRANAIGPRKRPLHNMSPLLVLRDDAPWLAVGGAGGRTIVSTLSHVLVRVIDRAEGLEGALTAPRFHVETAEPVVVEEGGEALAAGLQRLGHRVELRPRFGALQAIQVGAGAGSMVGVADPRRAGTILWL
jgi:gamma-glutamyltranspeptidase/glutathione hydrolase